MSHFGFLAVILIASTIMGCTQGTPSITAAENLAAIELDNDQFASKVLDSYDVILTGKIVRLVDKLEVSLDGGSSWESLNSNGATVLNINQTDCTLSCSFSFTIENVGDKWPQVKNLAANDFIKLKLRGQSLYGATNAVDFEIKRLRSGMYSVGALSINELGGRAKTLSSGMVVESGRLEAQTGAGVIQ